MARKGETRKPRLVEHLARLKRQPELDTRPRYGDGIPVISGDLATTPTAPEPVEVMWSTRCQDVPAAYTLVFRGAASADAKDCRLVRRRHLPGLATQG